MGTDASQTLAPFISNIIQNQSGSREQRENPINEAAQLPFDFNTIGNLRATFLNTERQGEQKDSQQNDGSSDEKGKRDDYVNDLDLD